MAHAADHAHELMPYTVENHPLTGMYSGKLGTWVFLASEVMLFGALFSTYIILRVANPQLFADSQTELSVPIGAINTAILIISSVTMVLAWAELHRDNLAGCKKYLVITLVCAITFILLKIFLEYIPKLNHGHGPGSNNYFGIYFLMTGLHALHIVGGIIVIAYFAGPGAGLYKTNPQYYTNRIECTGLYWHFVDLVWIFLFPVIYLL